MGRVASVVAVSLDLEAVKLRVKVDLMARTALTAETMAAAKEAVWTWGAFLSGTSCLCRLNKVTTNRT